MERVHATHRAPKLLTGQLTADVRVRGEPCACMRAHMASMLLALLLATSEGRPSCLWKCTQPHKALTLLTGQLTADVRVHGRLCACMGAHATSALLVHAHTKTQGAQAAT